MFLVSIVVQNGPKTMVGRHYIFGISKLDMGDVRKNTLLENDDLDEVIRKT